MERFPIISIITMVSSIFITMVSSILIMMKDDQGELEGDVEKLLRKPSNLVSLVPQLTIKAETSF